MILKKMSKLLKKILFVFILMVLLIPSAFAVSKSGSKYTGFKLINQSKRIGEWMNYAYKCGFGLKYIIAEEVGKLSWEDYKAFNSGWSKVNRLSVKNCSKNKDKAEKILNNYLKDLSNRVNKELGLQP